MDDIQMAKVESSWRFIKAYENDEDHDVILDVSIINEQGYSVHHRVPIHRANLEIVKPVKIK